MSTLSEMQARAEAAEAEVERLKKGYLQAGVNSLDRRFRAAINKLFEPCFEEAKSEDARRGPCMYPFWWNR